ncbi:transcript variant X2, partial [Nothobranchius furzeri]
NGHSIPFILDTGSQVTMLSKSMFTKYLEGTSSVCCCFAVSRCVKGHLFFIIISYELYLCYFTDSYGTLDLTDAATPTASDVTSGSGSHLEGEDDDDVMDENTDANIGESGPSMTVPSQSTPPSNTTAATPGELSKYCY